MTLATALLTVALSWSPPATPKGHEPEPRAAYAARLETIATAIATHARSPEEGTLVLVLFRAESALDPIIHAGGIHPVYDQDKGRARCLGQLHANRKLPHDAWLATGGTDLASTERCVVATLRALRSAQWMCMKGNVLTAPDVERVLAQYGHGGRSCAPTQSSRARAVTWANAVRLVRAGVWRAGREEVARGD